MCEQCRLAPSALSQITHEELDNMSEEEIEKLIKDLEDTSISYPQHWRNRGNYYGYPSCCINAFIRRSIDVEFTEDELLYSKGGFLPCKKHLKMIKQGKITIESLIQDRQCVTSFPIDDLDTNNASYADNQTKY